MFSDSQVALKVDKGIHHKGKISPKSYEIGVVLVYNSTKFVMFVRQYIC